jgi:hypothetical protein
MNLRTLSNPRMIVVVGTAMIALTGCVGGGSASGDPTTASPVASANSLLDLARCMRANGYPNFPDPIQDEAGAWTFPDFEENYKAPTACAALGRDHKIAENEANQLSAEDMTKRRQYSSCMRRNGVPDFPDPDDDGNFPLSDRLRALDNDPTMRGAREACKEWEPPTRANKPAPTPS